MNDRADWREIFNSEVRALQALYPLAHAALLNWGAWSRELKDIPGKTNGLTAPGWVQFYQPDPDRGWADEEDEAKAQRAEAPETPFGERDKAPRSDERLGEVVDIALHDEDFPAAWRKLLWAAYMTTDLPEYELPRVAKIRNAEDFLTLMDGALAYLERMMG